MCLHMEMVKASANLLRQNAMACASKGDRTQLNKAGDPQHAVPAPPICQCTERNGEEEQAQALDALEPTDHALVAMLLCTMNVLISCCTNTSVLMRIAFSLPVEHGKVVGQSDYQHHSIHMLPARSHFR